jgi:hypothetical protein
MQRYAAAMRGALERHGGTVEKLIGDAVVAVFGVPLVCEDDALRAVRAATDMVAAVAGLDAELHARWGVGLQVRTGVNTGEVVAGDPARGESLVTGDAVNTAARLEQHAEPGQILLGARTPVIVADAVAAEPVPPLAAKGKAKPVPAFRLVSLEPAERRRRVREGALVGRADELASLEDAFGRANWERRCLAMTILGDAGIGKSRLVEELLSRETSKAATLQGRCLPYGEGITYWPVAEVVREAASIALEDPPEVAAAKLAALVEGEPDAASVHERVAGAIGLSGATPPPQRSGLGRAPPPGDPGPSSFAHRRARRSPVGRAHALGAPRPPGTAPPAHRYCSSARHAPCSWRRGQPGVRFCA